MSSQPAQPFPSPPIMKLNDDTTKRNVSESTKKTVAAKQEWKCGLCKRILDETYEVDHVIPLYKGGSNGVENLMALDPICHRKKTIADRLS
jgi:5-methylcytosine-specific restriction endonuclease McrA